MPNRLSTETSPYLRQHSDNPVDWFSWGPDAFAEASKRNVPILLSVGYSACHWCHVMAHECFEDLETSQMMNELFVNIKVDREERPDVDALYMDAVQAMSGRGGWPMTVFMSPAGKPFFGGTYFPKPSFLKLMTAIDDAWKNRREDIENNINTLIETLGRTTAVAPDETLPAGDLINTACAQFVESFDQKWGGFGSAPKFPSTMNLDLLIRAYINKPDPNLKTVVTTSLDAMASGGMYDHIGGGFSRYSVDEKWLVPHFEKMLYDQALLLRVYTHAAAIFENAAYKQVCEEIVEYVCRDLRHQDGGFFSAEDADSLDEVGHSHEGHFYVFTIDQLHEFLSTEDATIATEFYGFSPLGNFEGKTIPNRIDNRGNFKRSAKVDEIRTKIFAQRNKRARPLLDDKILTEWNAMMTASLVESAVLFNRPDWLQVAVQNGEFLYRELRVQNSETKSAIWMRSWQQSGQPKARHRCLAADLANLIDAFTRLGEATGKAIWFGRAQEVAEDLIENYWDARLGGFFTVGADAEQLIVRQKDLLDNATPSANSMAANALLRLGAITGRADLTKYALDTLRLFTRILAGAPSAFGNLLIAVMMQQQGLTEIAITGERPDLIAHLNTKWLPNTVRVFGETFDSPLWNDRQPGFAFVCRDYVCGAPAATVQDLDQVLVQTTQN